mmetsp:Transcript_19332/g.17146  ORF Transcript_19332/g.17146 Transcript_19332/m.17146 type:complete len:118 (+) Transcript_19332:180-533(+)
MHPSQDTGEKNNGTYTKDTEVKNMINENSTRQNSMAIGNYNDIAEYQLNMGPMYLNNYQSPMKKNYLDSLKGNYSQTPQAKMNDFNMYKTVEAKQSPLNLMAKSAMNNESEKKKSNL